MSNIHPTVQQWTAALEAEDSSGLRALLADDAVLVSPITNAFRFSGGDAVAAVCGSGMSVLRDSRIDSVVGSGDEYVLLTSATLKGEPFQEAQFLSLDGDGRIRRVTLLTRPLPALLTLMASIGPHLAEAGVLTKGAALASSGIAPLAAVMRLMEKHVLPRLPGPPQG